MLTLLCYIAILLKSILHDYLNRNYKYDKKLNILVSSILNEHIQQTKMLFRFHHQCLFVKIIICTVLVIFIVKNSAVF